VARTVRLDVVTPERRVWSGEVEILIARGSEGELGILPGHSPLITALKDGVLLLRRADGATVRIASEGGFLEVEPDGITVLAASARLPEDVDAQREFARLDRG
jgi:F-type H+-transporting ATPase subunit epsilon